MQFQELENKILTQIDGLNEGSDFVKFTTFCGMSFRMHHYQDCCENVEISDICGDVNDLLYAPIVSAREESSDAGTDVRDSGTWTFYHIATTKGSVVIRWLGESNGYYSESVSFERITTEH